MARGSLTSDGAVPTFSQEGRDERGIPGISTGQWSQARPAREALPAECFEEVAKTRRQRGRPPSETTKAPVTIRLDADLVAHFKAGGKGWQSRINAALRKAAGFDPA